MPIQNLEWQPNPNSFRIANSDIHIWRVFTSQDNASDENKLNVLSGDELARAERFHKIDDANRFIEQRATLRAILGWYLGVLPRDIRIDYTPLGKPKLHSPNNKHNLEFNITHSGELMLVALTTDRNVGIDVERIRPMADIRRMIELYFSPGDFEELSSYNESERLAAFFCGWTRKEALLKAIGEGLQLPLDKIDVSWDPEETRPSLIIPADLRGLSDYHLFSFHPADSYVAALAVEGEIWNVRSFQFSQ
jgi:4'-phosphopantetheinyl transferase